MCGCGLAAPVSSRTNHSKNWVKGKSRAFVRHHHCARPWHWVETETGFSSPCWLVEGKKVDPTGYVKWHARFLHVWVWEDAHGKVPEGLEIDHLCGRRTCVRPDHLEVITHAENVRRGRAAKLNPRLAEQIRQETGTLREIAEKYGLHHTTVMDVRSGLSWS